MAVTDTFSDEREELMVSPTGEGVPTLRIAHLLKPTVPSTHAPKTLKPPSSISLSSKPQVPLCGWRNPPPSWKSWVDRMRPLHQHTWRSAGIYESVISSTYTIFKHQDSIFAIAEKWCSKTNTFMFPWGEATVTLEDMMVLGGYSVLGVSPISIPSDSELAETEDFLNKQRKEFIKTKSQKALQSLWLNHFMGSGTSNFEHEAFLSLWLSRFVFTEIYGIVPQHVLRVAVHLARGTKIALAPAVLASLYKNLSLLRTQMAKPSEHHSETAIASPLSLVMAWVWERFPTLQPNPNVLGLDQPRLARWGDTKKREIHNVKSELERAGDSFLWRPYALPVPNWSYPKFYGELQDVPLRVGVGFDEEIESFVRCLRVSKLVGFDCIEQYLPHRVAMQFGFDQDIPGWVTPAKVSHEMAWKRYSRPVCDANLYIPSRLFESDVTTRYLEWWKKSVFGGTRRQQSKSESRRPLKSSRDTSSSDSSPSLVASHVPPKRNDNSSSNSSDDDHIPIVTFKLRHGNGRNTCIQDQESTLEVNVVPELPAENVEVNTGENVEVELARASKRKNVDESTSKSTDIDNGVDKGFSEVPPENLEVNVEKATPGNIVVVAKEIRMELTEAAEVIREGSEPARVAKRQKVEATTCKTVDLDKGVGIARWGYLKKAQELKKRVEKLEKLFSQVREMLKDNEKMHAVVS